MKYLLLFLSALLLFTVSCSDDESQTCTNDGKKVKCTLSGSGINYDFESWSLSVNDSNIQGIRTITIVAKSKTSDCSTEYEIMMKREDFNYDKSNYDLDEAYVKKTTDGTSQEFKKLVSGTISGYYDEAVEDQRYFNFEFEVENDGGDKVSVTGGTIDDSPND